MSIWNALNNAYSYEDAFRAKDCTSDAMRAAVGEWFRLYYQREPTEDSDPCQQIAYTIVNKLTKTAFGEYKADSEDDFAQAVLDALGAVKKTAMQLALVGREAVRLCGALGQLYHVPEAHDVPEDAVSIDWGNGILYDEDKTWADYLDMVARGMMKPEIALGWRFNMPTETDTDLAAIRAKYMPDQLLDGDL